MTDYQIVHLLAVALSKESRSLRELHGELLKILRDDKTRDSLILRSAAHNLLKAIREYNKINDTYKMECATFYLEAME